MGRSRRRSAPLGRSVVRGALAGAAATWAMDRVTTFLYERESKHVQHKEDEARGHGTAYDTAAEKAGRVMGIDLSETERQKAGIAIHWLLGAVAGATYGLLRDRFPASSAGAGLLFGTAFWLVIDEGANYALRLTPGPLAFPWQAHARGLAGHLIFGATADATLRTLETVA